MSEESLRNLWSSIVYVGRENLDILKAKLPEKETSSSPEEKLKINFWRRLLM